MYQNSTQQKAGFGILGATYRHRDGTTYWRLQKHPNPQPYNTTYALCGIGPVMGQCQNITAAELRSDWNLHRSPHWQVRS